MKKALSFLLIYLLAAAGGSAAILYWGPACLPPVLAYLTAPRPVATAPRPAAAVRATPAPAARPPAPPPKPNRWGVVASHGAKAYSSSGQYLQELSCGTVLEITEVRDTQSGAMAICKGTLAGFTPYVIPTQFVDLASTPVTDRKPEEVELRKQKAELLAEREKVRREVADKNPFAKELGEARKEYLGMMQRAKDLQSQRDKGHGAGTVEAADELRLMKNESAALAIKIKALAAKHQEWQEQHPNVSDPRIDPLDSKLSAIEQQLAPFQKGL